MKTILNLACMIFFLSAVNVFAGTDTDTPGTVTILSSEIQLKSLAPVTPREATFTDDLMIETTDPEAISLAPITPVNAPFDEFLPEQSSLKERLMKFFPSVPAETDFNDSVQFKPVTRILHPITPSEASFE
jgi:hypothetical protein